MDFQARRRLSGLSLNYFILSEFVLPPVRVAPQLRSLALRLAAPNQVLSSVWLARPAIVGSMGARGSWALQESERLRLRCSLDAVCLAIMNLALDDATILLADDLRSAADAGALNPKGFWRVDKDKDPELRHTVLTLVAFADLQEKIRGGGGDREKGIDAFLNQNDREGWMLPETLRLADYGLGHDERATVPQPVASRLGPRFYDWQLAQTAEESWRECQIHARNLAGDTERRGEVKEATINRGRPSESASDSAPSSASSTGPTATTQPSFLKDDADE